MGVAGGADLTEADGAGADGATLTGLGATALAAVGTCATTGLAGKGGGPSCAAGGVTAAEEATAAARACFPSKTATLLSKLETLPQRTMTKIGTPKNKNATNRTRMTSMPASVARPLTLSTLS